MQAEAAQCQANKNWRSLDLEPQVANNTACSTPGRPTFKTQRSSSVPTPKSHRTGGADICAGIIIITFFIHIDIGVVFDSTTTVKKHILTITRNIIHGL